MSHNISPDYSGMLYKYLNFDVPICTHCKKLRHAHEYKKCVSGELSSNRHFLFPLGKTHIETCTKEISFCKSNIPETTFLQSSYAPKIQVRNYYPVGT